MTRIVTFTRSVRYNLDEMADSLIALDEEGKVYHESELLDLAWDWAREDLSCGWGHQFDGYLDMEVTDE